jgi:hypothetical protein
MFQSLGPAFRSTAAFVGPIVREGAKQAIKDGTTLVIGTGLYVSAFAAVYGAVKGIHSLEDRLNAPLERRKAAKRAKLYAAFGNVNAKPAPSAYDVTQAAADAENNKALKLTPEPAPV